MSVSEKYNETRTEYKLASNNDGEQGVLEINTDIYVKNVARRCFK